MMSLLARCRPVLFALFGLAFAGCFPLDRSSLEGEKDPHFLDGQRRVASLDYDGAIESFEKALQTNPGNAAAHLELGLLYDERKRDPAEAIHHYQKHLKLRPDSPMADVLNPKIMACKRELAQSAAFVVGPRDFQRDLERLTATNNLLQAKIQQLEAELARKPALVTNFAATPIPAPTLRPADTASAPAPQPQISQRQTEQRPPTTPRTATPQSARGRPTATVAAPTENSGDWVPSFTSPPAKPVSKARSAPRATYTVKAGDTLASIARRYGVTAQALSAANPAIRSGQVRTGQTLVIPGR